MFNLERPKSVSLVLTVLPPIMSKPVAPGAHVHPTDQPVKVGILLARAMRIPINRANAVVVTNTLDSPVMKWPELVNASIIPVAIIVILVVLDIMEIHLKGLGMIVSPVHVQIKAHVLWLNHHQLVSIQFMPLVSTVPLVQPELAVKSVSIISTVIHWV